MRQKLNRCPWVTGKKGNIYGIKELEPKKSEPIKHIVQLIKSMNL